MISSSLTPIILFTYSPSNTVRLLFGVQLSISIIKESCLYTNPVNYEILVCHLPGKRTTGRHSSEGTPLSGPDVVGTQSGRKHAFVFFAVL